MTSAEINWEREQVTKAISFLEQQLRNTGDYFQKMEIIQNIQKLDKRLYELSGWRNN